MKNKKKIQISEMYRNENFQPKNKFQLFIVMNKRQKMFFVIVIPSVKYTDFSLENNGKRNLPKAKIKSIFVSISFCKLFVSSLFSNFNNI